MSIGFQFSGLRKQVVWYAALLGFSALLCWRTFYELVVLAVQDERYSYTIVIPFISAALIWFRRSRIFRNSHASPRVGVSLLALGVLLYWLVGGQLIGALWLSSVSVVLIWTAGFILTFGLSSARAAIFPLLFLWLLIPVPDAWMKFIQIALQRASADVTFALFRLTGMPVFRQGFTFSLPGVDVQVAEECSGIRSSVSLVIVTLVASQLFLKSGWRQICLVLLAIPIVIFKNAVRITTLSWLGVYVSRDFFYGDLHHFGGLPFSLLAFALLIPALWALQRSEEQSAGKPPMSR